jgi:hypothetical protein
MTLNSMPAPKRIAPPKVKPVTIGDLRFEALHWGKDRDLGQNGGYVTATEVKSGKEAWIQKIYTIKYEAGMEEDVQDLFIAKMKAAGDKLAIADEDGRKFVLDPATRKVVAG